MRILNIDMKNMRIVLRPEIPTDLYILSNLISLGDRVIAKTSRRIRRVGSENRSGDESQRITMIIGIEVEDLAFQDNSVSNRLRVKGRIFQGPEQHIAIGSYHTLNIGLSHAITIIKPEWSKYYLQMLKEAEEASKKPKICLIAIDKAEACIGILDNFQLQVLFQEKSHIPRKRSKEKIRSQKTENFFDYIADYIQQQILNETKNIVIGGPGFVKESLNMFLKDKFPKENLNIIVAGSTSGGNRVGLSELLQMEAIDKLANDFRILQEQKLIDEFFKRVNQGTNDVAYGFSYIQQIANTGVIETLILLDSLLRSRTINSEQIQSLLHEVEKLRGKILIISSQSENSTRLKTFGGIIALLRYPLTWE